MADGTEPNQEGQFPFNDDDKVTKDNGSTTPTRHVNTGITVESLYLILAMWMEMFPEQGSSSDDSDSSAAADPVKVRVSDKSADFYRKIGCILVQQDGRLVAIDRSRNGVHGLARLLVKHHDKAKGSSVFVSRKPCTYCAKLLVKAGITKVLYPPFEPEFYSSKEEKRVGVLFDAGQVTHCVFIPQIRMELTTATETELVARGITLSDIQGYTQKVFRRFWNEECVRHMSVGSIEEAYSKFENLVKWLAQIYLPLERSKFRCFSGDKEPSSTSEDTIIRTFDPENDAYQGKIAKHLLSLAAMTIQRTVEPKTGVGCVIMKNNDIVAVGWNDFPSRIIEDDFHNASDQERDKKYPFFVHAEQNALLMRNLTDVSGGVIFVTKTPCHECTPLVKVSGIGTVVLATSLEPIKEKYRLNYEVFQEELHKGSFLCYEMSTI